MRYFIEFAYNGTSYHGWQRQPNAISVQQVLEEALSLLLRQNISVVGAGRTDAGVHAKQMFAHLDVAKKLDVNELVKRLNNYLPKDIAIKRIFPVKADAHARFDATLRAYEYIIVPFKDPFSQESAHHVFLPLDVEVMNQEAKDLIGRQDFECFSKSHTDVHTYFCTITQAGWQKVGDKLVFTIAADRFLRNMVRAVVGTLLDVGLHKKPSGHIKKVIASKSRGEAGVSVPAKGLYLTRVEYSDIEIDE